VHILFLTHYFLPETNAPANRVLELAREWVRLGHRVTVVTSAPNHPTGKLHPGYQNRLLFRETVDGIDVIRLWTFLAANEGFVLRTTNYVSFMVSAALQSFRLPKPDVVVSTSPQFFCGLAGYAVSRMKGKPWALEIRDLWPESIVAVGAMKNKTAIAALEGLERWAYRKADRIVTVTDSFVGHVADHGGARNKIHVVKNGVDLATFTGSADDSAFRAAHGLTGKFVAAYVGTHGMAHQLESILEAAALTRDDPRIAYLMVGGGAERARLLALRDAQKLTNVVMLDQQPRSDMPVIWSASDVSLVLLRKSPLFETVIPSKMFEAMGMRRPMILGVRGEALSLMTDAGSGIGIDPGNATELAAAVRQLASDPALVTRLGDSGRSFVEAHFDRTVLARRYLDILSEITPATLVTTAVPARAATGS
jgi:glycosyltransferase involved in cell wall biosynthesis